LQAAAEFLGAICYLFGKVATMNHPLTTRAAECLARRAFTVAEVYRMCEAGILDPDERFELIEGEIVPMNAKNRRHEIVQSDLNAFLVARLPKACKLAIEPTARLSELSFIGPDFVIHRADLGLAPITPAEIMLLIEVADTSLAFDLGRKARLCAAHGIREYWVVNADTLVTTVHRNPATNGYAFVRIRGPNALLAPTHPALKELKLRMREIA
jgi:Uma2 family endonuclease